MGETFRIRVGEEECVCEFLEAEAPNVTAAFKQALPMRSFAMHAKFAGDEIMAMLPLLVEPDFLRPDGCQTGDVAFNPLRQTLCFFYGEVTPFGKPGNAFARLVEGQEAMQRAAQALLEQGRLPVEVYLDGARPSESSFPPSPTMTPITERVRQFIQENWDAEPDDLARLREVSRPYTGNSPGVLDSFYSLFWAVDTIQTFRDLATAETLDLSAVNQTTLALLKRAGNRVGRWNLVDTAAMLNDVQQYFASTPPTSLDDYLSVTQDLMIALNRIQHWIDSAFPWTALDEAIGDKLAKRW